MRMRSRKKKFEIFVFLFTHITFFITSFNVWDNMCYPLRHISGILLCIWFMGFRCISPIERNCFHGHWYWTGRSIWSNNWTLFSSDITMRRLINKDEKMVNGSELHYLNTVRFHHSIFRSDSLFWINSIAIIIIVLSNCIRCKMWNEKHFIIIN